MTRTLVRHALRSLASIVYFGVLVVGAAWTLDLPRVWLFLAVNLLGGLVHAAVVNRVNPDLLHHRMTAKPDTRPEDVRLTKRLALLLPFLLLTLGLDLGHLHVVRIPWSVSLVALGLHALALAVTTWSMAANRHFETTIRIQSDRDHRVIDHGPYAWVRHPGYAVGALGLLLQPLIMGSGLGLVPAAIAAGVVVVRTRLEDGVLHADLPGYAEYAARVRWRLVPGIW